MTDSRGEPAARRPNESALPRVVIVGGGFGGLYAAEALKRAPVEVTVVDRSNHHVFQPLLYQVATASLAPSDVAYPIRVVLSGQRNTTVILAEATAVDVPNRRVILKDGWLDYDDLIVAPGARHSYFAHPEWEEVAPGLKTMEDALAIRRRVLLAFERAERESDPERRRALLTFSPDAVTIGKEHVSAATILWTAGVQPSPLARSLGVPLDRVGRVIVDPDLTVPGHPEIYVVGDLAACGGPGGPPLPGLAPVAVQQGRHAAHNILRGGPSRRSAIATAGPWP